MGLLGVMFLVILFGILKHRCVSVCFLCVCM